MNRLRHFWWRLHWSHITSVWRPRRWSGYWRPVLWGFVGRQFAFGTPEDERYEELGRLVYRFDFDAVDWKVRHEFGEPPAPVAAPYFYGDAA